jgi:sec-independent protein translocase protein TatA
MAFSPPAELFGEQGIIVLIVIAVVLFGSTQIPKLARSLGSAQKEFKKGLDEGANGEAGSDPAPATQVAPQVIQAPAPQVIQAPAPQVVQAPAPQVVAPAPAPAPAPPAADGTADATP